MITLAALLCSLASHALQDNRGTDFWLTFGINYGVGARQIDLQVRLVAGSVPATVTLRFTQNNAAISFNLAAFQALTYSLNASTEQPLVYNMATGVSNFSVHITSTTPVAAYALNQYSETTDATHILPVPALGTDYYQISYTPNVTIPNQDAYAVVATEDNTQVFHNGTLTATLNTGQVYYRNENNLDMTGTRINSDKPVAVFSVNPITNIPYRDPYTSWSAADHLFEQMAPVSTWGTNYFIPILAMQNFTGAQNVVRVVASQNGTDITLVGGGTLSTNIPGAQTSLTNLQAGQWVEISVRALTNGCFIQSNNPVGVCTYMPSQSASGSTGDPSIAWMPPVEQMIDSATVAAFVPQAGLSKLDAHYAVIITPTATKNDTRVKAGSFAPATLNSTLWRDHSSGYSYYVMNITGSNTSFLFTNPTGHLFVMGYGTGPYESYAYLAGSAVRTLDAAFYVNEIGNEDLINEIFCTQPLQFRAELLGDLSTFPGFLKWYIDGVEIMAARDSTTWSTTLPSGTYQVRMDARMSDEMTIRTVEGTLTVLLTEAYNDYVQTFVNTPVDVSVLDNDSLGCCGLSGITGLSIVPGENGKNGTAVLNGNILTYTPNTGFAGKDSVTYTYDCSGTINTAKVYITVVKMPDNISDAECFTDPPTTVWDMEVKSVSDGGAVYELATPWVGDLDGDGRNEVVVPNNDGYVSPNYYSRGMLIFDDSLKLKSSFATPDMPEYGTMTNLIADVDNDGFGEIIVATTAKRLVCYDMNGTVKWTSSDVISYRTLTVFCPSPIIADLNSDGFAEILALDNIFDAATGVLIAQLPAGSGRGRAAGGPAESYMPVFADMDGDGLQEAVAGNTVYKVNITNRSGLAGNSVSVLSQIGMPDGFTSVADIDLDGDLDVVVTGALNDTELSLTALFYVWDGDTPSLIGNVKQFPSAQSRISRAFIGDINGDGRPDVAFTYVNNIVAYFYNGTVFTEMFHNTTTDASGATTMSMFDFNLDGEVELVYRDESDLRIIDKNGNNLTAFSCISATHTEYPVVVDLDRDGSADILVSGVDTTRSGDVRIIRYGSVTPGAWASARSVWNQHAYNATNINEDLSVPQFPMNNATVFPGNDGVLGTADDLRPFNSFLQQQTMLNVNGEPLWLVPDVYTNQSLIQTTLVGDSLAVTVKFVNEGEVSIGAPVYVSLYREKSPQSFGVADLIAADSVDVQLMPGDTAEIVFEIPDITAFFPMANIVVRLNDDGKTFPRQPECDYDDDTVTVPNPAIGLMMKKRATLNGVQDNGRYPNPVSVLFSEEILYEITAVNASAVSGQNIVITDTLPPYLRYVGGSSSHSGALASLTSLTPPRESITWIAAVLPGLAPLDSVTVSFRATPVSGAVASQPLFINRAWVSILSSNVTVPTNSTYHQGAGVAVVTFSASLGGWIFNAGEQALDYRTSPRSGIEVIPEEGYEFAGWSHDSYTSLRGEIVPADSGIFDYEDIVIHGNVELHANFVPAGRNRHIGIVEEEQIPEQPETDRVWAVGDMLYVTPAKAGSVLRIYTVEGVLREQHALVSVGTSTYRLPRGVYIVTVNGGGGRKIASLP